MIRTVLLLAAGIGGALSLGERTWSEYVTMDDGVKLHTRITVPRDYVEGEQRTVVMDRSPYGQFGIELLDDLFVPAGFITVCQDMRGTGLSGGRFSNWKSDANDSLTTGNWVVQQNWSNHAIYLFGASADGLGGFTTNYNSPEWLQSQVSVSRLFFLGLPISSLLFDLSISSGPLLSDMRSFIPTARCCITC